MGAYGTRHPRMHDIVRLRRCLAIESGNVVVLDIVPFDVGDIEHVHGEQPMLWFLKTDLGIDCGVGRGPRTIVLDQRRLSEMPRAQRSKPPGLTVRRQSCIHHIGRAVGNVAPDDANGRRAWVTWGRIRAAQIVRIRVTIKSRFGEGRIEFGAQPTIDVIGIAPFNTGACGGTTWFGDAGITVKYQFGPQLQLEYIEGRCQVGDDGGRDANLGTGGPGQGGYGADIRIFATACHAPCVITVVAIAGIEEHCGFRPWAQNDSEFRAENVCLLIARHTTFWVAQEVAAPVAVEHFVFDVEVEFILPQSQYGAQIGDPLNAVLCIHSATGLQHAGTLCRADNPPLVCWEDSDIADIIDACLNSDYIRHRKSE